MKKIIPVTDLYRNFLEQRNRCSHASCDRKSYQQGLCHKHLFEHKASVNGLTPAEFRLQKRIKTAAKKGMTVPEYNFYVKKRAAERAGLSVEEYNRIQYAKVINKRGLSINEYQKSLKRIEVEQN